MTRRNLWASVEAAETLSKQLGYTTNRVDLLDINQTVMLDLNGHGELVEVYFKVAPTGYLAYHRTFAHGGRRGDVILTWQRTQEWLEEAARPYGSTATPNHDTEPEGAQ